MTDQTRTHQPTTVYEPDRGLLDKEFITSRVTMGDPWCSSHGSGECSEDLSAGMLCYNLAYSLKAKTCLCIGSGGGFVPRLMRQAQRDLRNEGSRTILVDGAHDVPQKKKDIWGSPCWLEYGSPFRSNYPDVEILLKLTEDAHREFFIPNRIQIDFLHIDGDHHYEGAKLDWELFSPLVPDEGIITLHDTQNYREPCGVYKLVDEIRRDGRYSVIDCAIKYGTALVRKNPPPRS